MAVGLGRIVTDDYTAPRVVQTYRTLEPGDKLTFTEWFSYYITRPLRTFRRSCKVTPALRERCVQYALDGGAQHEWQIRAEAEKIAAYISKGNTQ